MVLLAEEALGEELELLLNEEIMKKVNSLIPVVFLFFTIATYAQESAKLQKVFRANILNPGVEIELPISQKSIISINPGVGFNFSYDELHFPGGETGLSYYIAPFLDLSCKHIYNYDKRFDSGKSNSFNSGNYLGVRCLINFKEVAKNNIIRTDKIDFAVGPTWGIQRSYKNVHFLFDVGPVYFSDTKGNNGFFPIMLQLNIGYNLKKW